MNQATAGCDRCRGRGAPGSNKCRARQNVAPTDYYDWLAPYAQSVDVWQTTYHHVMADAHAIVEWVKGTGLRPYLEALGDDQERADYESAYTTAMDTAYPPRADGRRLFSFPRLFVVAIR